MGPPESWSESMRATVRMVLDSRLPMTFAWGDDLIQIYNEGYLQILGDKHPAALGRPVREVYPEIWPEIGPLLEEVYTSAEAVWLEDQRLLIDRRGFGEEMYFTFSYSPVKSGDGAIIGVLSSAVDTTAHVLAERRIETVNRLATTNSTSLRGMLEESLERIDEASSDLPVCLAYEVDAPTRSLELLGSTGVSQATVPTNESISAVLPWDRHAADAPVIDLPPETLATVEVIDDGRPGISQVVWVPLSDGESHSGCCIAGLVVGLSEWLAPDANYLQHLEDVSRTLSGKIEHLRYQKLLVANAERRYSAAFENSLDAMLLTAPDGVILEANPAACELLGYTEGEICELGRGGIVDQSDERLPAALAIRQATGEFRGELNYVHRDGHSIPCEVSSRIYFDAGGNKRTCVIARDLRRRLELESSLRQAQKLEVVGKLASGVAHDFNNLLTIIDSSAEFLLREVEPGSEAAEDAQVIQTAGERATALTRRLLAFSRHQAVHSTHLNLAEVVHEVDTILRPLLGEHIEVICSITADPWTVYADRQRIEQILLNLVVNARDAMPDGGTLTIELANEEVEETRRGVLGAELEAGRYVRLGVTDTGVGLPGDDWARLFEPFYTTRQEGTGLGLATVADVVLECEGGIFLESEPNQGTRFDVHLPVSHSARTEQSADDRSPKPPEPLSGHILLIEDQPLVRKTTARVLQEAGLEVTAVAGGSQALDLVDKRGALAFDLVIADVVMPHMSGQEVVKRLSKIGPQLKFLFISGYPDNFYLGRSSELAVDILMKPYTSAKLTETVRALLEAG